ncbi:MAG: GntR family transcriptional regulator, partial [Desulfovibrionales bacterium]|nr:GntR family transcriptional regulator [Desulfovibrionales bacterium]
MMKPIKKMRISTIIVESIEGMIQAENLQPGDKLPSENQLAKQLHVSRTSVREAVLMLELQGRVRVQQGKGIFLSQTTPTWFQHHQESIEELFEVRILVESHAEAKAAKA